MKNRIFNNWNFKRIMYLGLGIVVIVQSYLSNQWLGVAMGSYLAAMGLFAFGCASGNCYGGSCSVDLSGKKNKEQDTNFEEVTTK
jgi:hypothetical protein